MVKSKIKILFYSLLLVVVMFVALPKSYIHSLLGHKHNVSHETIAGIIVSGNNETEDCNIEKFDTPVYYSVFKFILNFLPINTTKETVFQFNQKQILNSFYSISLFRSLPIA